MKTALITGGMGFIGAFIARRVLDEGLVDRVVLLDHYGRYVDSTRSDFVDYRRLRIADVADRVVIERGEARYLSVVSQVLRKYRPEYVFHLAALPLAKLPNLHAEEAMEGSVMSTSNILETLGALAQECGYRPERFVYTSSSMVYGDFLCTPVTEEHPTCPKEIYGTMKLAGEVVARGLAQFHGVKYTIVRPSAVYGPTDMNRRVSQIFIEKAMAGETITVQGADEALDFTYVKDVAKGFFLAAVRDAAVGETFNITHGQAHTLLDFVTALREHFPELRYEITERDTFRPKRGTLSIEKAQRLLGYAPDYDLKTGLCEYIDFLRRHHPRFPHQTTD